VTTPIVAFRGVGKRFQGVVALSDVTFELQPGECHAICGENGAGKSTLMKILSGVITEHEGEILVRGQPVSFRGTRDAESAGIAIIHQELNLVEQLPAAANIFLGRERRTRLGLLDDAAMELEAGSLLAGLDCQIDPRVPAGSLRVGDQQLLEIAKALSLQSDVLIMDEPTSALTEAEVARLYRVIAQLRERGVTILYISHKMDEVFRLADRITVLRDGRQVRTVPRSATTPKEITGWMVGREIAGQQFHQARPRGRRLLEVRGLTLPWPGHPRGYRLKDIDLELHAGEVLGVAGLMGAGRTELLEVIFGAAGLDWTGEIRLEDEPVRFRPPGRGLRGPGRDGDGRPQATGTVSRTRCRRQREHCQSWEGLRRRTRLAGPRGGTRRPHDPRDGRQGGRAPGFDHGTLRRQSAEVHPRPLASHRATAAAA
jgi:ribose transport system ATP-binding protein